MLNKTELPYFFSHFYHKIKHFSLKEFENLPMSRAGGGVMHDKM